MVKKVRPDEIYHLAAQSFVSYSFEDEFSTLNSNINGTHFMLAAARELALSANICETLTPLKFNVEGESGKVI